MNRFPGCFLRLTIRQILCVWVGACLSLYSTSAEPPPNLVLFLVDDMGWQDTSVPFWTQTTLANRHFRTPNMERLARQGRKFTQAYACAVCSPTRTSLMTGQNAARHRVTNWTLYPDRETSGQTPRLQAPLEWNRRGLQPGQATLPQILRDLAGYRTIHVGKAHWGARDTPGADPLNLGFDINIAGHAAGGPGHYHGEKNYGNETPGSLTPPWGIPGLEKYHGTSTHLTEALTLEALEAIRGAVHQSKPFYLYLAHYAVHAPIQPHQKYLPNYQGKTYPGTDIPIPDLEARYASMVEGMDASLGSLLDELDRLGQAENTLIVFASDNGGLSIHSRSTTPYGTELNTHCWPLREGKGSAYEGGTRIPFLVSWARLNPDQSCQKHLRIPPGSQCDTPIMVEDWFPSLLHWAGVPSSDPILKNRDGMDLTPLLSGDSQSIGKEWLERPILFHYPHQWTGQPQGGYQPHSAIRQGSWKAIYFYQGQRWELYDLSQDIGETNNLATKHPQKLLKLAKQLKEELIRREAQWPHLKGNSGEVEPLLLPHQVVYPEASWIQRNPVDLGLHPSDLEKVSQFLKGRGFVVKDGYEVFRWGDVTRASDIASAAKPFYTHFLWQAVEKGKLESLEIPAQSFTPDLASINPKLDHKDRHILFRHLATQTSGYGVQEHPGKSFDYNDFQMALFWDTLFLGAYGSSYRSVDKEVLMPDLANPLQFEDPVSFMAFGEADRPGRMKISPRDFCRFGWLYLKEGTWKNHSLLAPESVRRILHSPLPHTFPRTEGQAAEMLEHQRSLGSRTIPDNQTDHFGSYSWLWWVNGKRASGKSFWPDAPPHTAACLGHENGKRGMAIVPEWNLVFSWNDSRLDEMEWKDPQLDPHPLNAVFRWLKPKTLSSE